MRLAVRFSKEAPVRFVSHLDLLRLFQRAFKRAKLPLAYSQGFNPHPLLSFATALSVGMTSECEYLDVTLTEYMDPSSFIESVSPALPEGVRILDAFDLGESRKSLTSAMKTAEYRAIVTYSRPVGADELNKALNELLSNEIVVMKKTKGGIKPVDIRPMVISVDVLDTEGRKAGFVIRGKLTAEGGLNPETFLKELSSKLGAEHTSDINRTEIELDGDMLF